MCSGNVIKLQGMSRAFHKNYGKFQSFLDLNYEGKDCKEKNKLVGPKETIRNNRIT